MVPQGGEMSITNDALKGIVLGLTIAKLVILLNG
jgi:hypothetical protein